VSEHEDQADFKRCGVGRGAECCAYLVAAGSGAECGRVGMKTTIDGLVHRMNAKRQPVEAWPDCQLDPDPGDGDAGDCS